MSKSHIEWLEEQCEPKKKPTLEEVKKEWEELGYEWKEIGRVIYLRNKEIDCEITIWVKGKIYACTLYKQVMSQMINFCEHQLLTKTFRALGWFDE